jgi:hypothetical protein
MDRPGPEGEPGLSRIQEESEMAEQFASGWENPDKHESMAERPRPMFDEQGKPVSEAPPAPEVESGLELVDDFLRPGDVQPRAQQPRHWLQDSAAPVAVGGGNPPLMADQSDLTALLTEIHRVASKAADSDSRVVWLAALGRIVELAVPR